MKAKNTPGPWHLEKYSGKHEYDFVWDKSNKIVCQLFSKSEDYFTNYKANAKLIAAAHELLEACLTAKAMYEAQGINENSRIGGAQYKRLLAAIKKATE